MVSRVKSLAGFTRVLWVRTARLVTLRECYQNDKTKEGDRRGMWHVWGRREMHVEFWGVKLSTSGRPWHGSEGQSELMWLRIEFWETWRSPWPNEEILQTLSYARNSPLFLNQRVQCPGPPHLALQHPVLPFTVCDCNYTSMVQSAILHVPIWSP